MTDQREAIAQAIQYWVDNDESGDLANAAEMILPFITAAEQRGYKQGRHDGITTKQNVILAERVDARRQGIAEARAAIEAAASDSRLWAGDPGALRDQIRAALDALVEPRGDES